MTHEPSQQAAQAFVDRSVRQTCVCSKARVDIEAHMFEVTEKEDDPILPRFYYRCASCRTYSAPSIYFPVEKYTSVPLDFIFVSELKQNLNRDRVRRIIEAGSITTKQPTLFDLGSGEGAFSHAFVEALPGGLAVACEADTRLEAKFYTDADRVEFVPSYIEEFLDEQLETGRWPAADLVVLTDVLEHVIEPEQLLSKVRDVMAPGGCGYFVVPNASTLGDGRPVASTEVDWEHANRTCQHIWMYDHDEFLRMVGSTLEIVHSDQTFETERRRDSVYTAVLARRPDV